MNPQWVGHHDCDNPAHVPIDVDEAGSQRLLGVRWVDTWRAAWKGSQREAFEAMIEEMIAVGKPGQYRSSSSRSRHRGRTAIIISTCS